MLIFTVFSHPAIYPNPGFNHTLFRASFLLLSSSQKMETLLLFLLSLNLSISPRKNESSFGLFPPLESLSDG
jgi:hypothetical protein